MIERSTLDPVHSNVANKHYKLALFWVVCHIEIYLMCPAHWWKCWRVVVYPTNAKQEFY